MLVCHCKAVSDREVRSAIEAGASSRRDVARHCGAGTVCGGCRPVIDELLGLGCGTTSTAEHRYELAAAS